MIQYLWEGVSFTTNKNHLSAKPTLIATTSRWTKRILKLPERVSGAWVDDTGQVEPSWTWAGAYSAILLRISCFSSSFGWWGLTTSQWLIRLKTQKRFTGSKIGAIFWQITSRVTTKNLKIGQRGNFELGPFFSLFLMRKTLSSGQKWFLRPYFPLIGGMFALRSGLSQNSLVAWFSNFLWWLVR